MQIELKPSTYIDEVPESPIDAAAVLPDEALAAGGLVPVAAFMRTRSSANASRLKKSRPKADVAGLLQLNVVVPVPGHAAIKAMARELQAGAALHDVLQATLVNASQSTESAQVGVPPSPLMASSRGTVAGPALAAASARASADASGAGRRWQQTLKPLNIARHRASRPPASGQFCDEF
ncbi:hypothetical protein [Pelomonas cellulosilytica]|uniref:Uncharacterized protein n=1 Tax=Pelomonas cellulosilytica TaxID=2906762 RepID=A0ABS8Y4M3_9BURK|nr:hypothetical protein [Pelomonas sp. P8]MCE4558256.1 hypothetical protein [Pelomonas sp. P8]